MESVNYQVRPKYYWLRWIAFFPVASIAYLSCFLCIALSNYVISLFYNITETGWYTEVFSNGIGSYMFIVAGSFIAPTRRSLVAWILTSFLALTLCLQVYLFIKGFSDFSTSKVIYVVIGTLIGSGYAFIERRDKEKELSESYSLSA